MHDTMTLRLFLGGLLLFVLMTACGGGPDSVADLKQKGIDAFVQGDYAQAREYLQRGLQRAPSDRDLLYFTGAAFKRDFRYDSALVYLNRAAVLHQGDREVAKQRLEVAMALELWDIALSCTRTLIDTGDPPEQHYLTQAQLWRNEGWPINEYLFLKLYLDSHPEDSMQYIPFANVAVTVDSLEVGQRYLDTAIARFGDRPILLAAKAVLYGAGGQYNRAERILRRLVAEDTASVDLRINLANMLSQQINLQKQQEALRLYESVQSLVTGAYPVDSLIALTKRRVDSLSN